MNSIKLSARSSASIATTPAVSGNVKATDRYNTKPSVVCIIPPAPWLHTGFERRKPEEVRHKVLAPPQITAFSAASLPSSAAQAELFATRTGFQDILLQDKSRALEWQGAYQIKWTLCFSGDTGKSESDAPECSYSVLQRVNDKSEHLPAMRP